MANEEMFDEDELIQFLPDDLRQKLHNMTKPQPPPEYIRSRCPTDCWIWQGRPDGAGYGRLCLGGKRKPEVHRFIYKVIYGDMPRNVVVGHFCDVRLCWRPSHLYRGTHKLNLDDMREKGRGAEGATHPVVLLVGHGARVAFSQPRKLIPAHLDLIRRLSIEEKVSPADLAKWANVTPSRILQILETATLGQSTRIDHSSQDFGNLTVRVDDIVVSKGHISVMLTYINQSTKTLVLALDHPLEHQSILVQTSKCPEGVRVDFTGKSHTFLLDRQKNRYQCIETRGFVGGWYGKHLNCSTAAPIRCTKWALDTALLTVPAYHTAPATLIFAVGELDILKELERCGLPDRLGVQDVLGGDERFTLLSDQLFVHYAADALGNLSPLPISRVLVTLPYLKPRFLPDVERLQT